MSTALLTRKQQQVYEFLQHLADRGAPAPTLDELCEGLRLRSRGSLHKHIRGLVEAGLVEDNAGRQRGVRLTARSTAWPDSTLPMLGRIAAGQPVEAVEAPDVIEVPASLRSDKPCFALRVRGDSMIEDGILDGDVVIVEQRDCARNGEIVVALVDGEDATLKRIIQRPNEIELWPANSQMEVMRYPPERVAIQGAVVGQMRSYRD
jgi:repressor LexA